MDWSKPAAWVYQDSAPDLGKISRYKIGTLYLDPRSNNVANIFSAYSALQVGIYMAANWYPPDISGYGFARQVSGEIGRLIPQAGRHPVMLDLEGKPAGWVSGCLQEYRRLRPVRETAYTNAPFQDGTVVPIAALLKAKMHWYVQLYYGDMSPADPAAALLEIARGYPPDMVHPFYDGERYPTDARDGCIFTLERLPLP